MSNPERIVIDDLVVLGNACPDELSDMRVSVCTAGFSPTYGLVRVYPVPPISPMKRWNVVRVPLERNPKDTRVESWKVQGSNMEWDKITEKIQKSGSIRSKKDKRDLLDELYGKFGATCIKELNRKKVSLGFIKPSISGHALESRNSLDTTVQERFGDSTTRFLTKRNYSLIPMLSYRCSGCEIAGQHNQQILEWGLYEWMRNHPEKPEQMWENLGIDKEGYECMLLVGNNNKYRTSFMVISILPIVMKTEMKGKAFPDFQSTLLQYGDGTELRSSHSTRV